MRKENRHPKSDYFVRLIAHAIARSALAIAGFFSAVSTLQRMCSASRHLEGLNSTGFVASMSLVGWTGFYLGIDIPRVHGFRLHFRIKTARLTLVLVDLLGATGTFIAVVAALISVYVIVFDEVLQLTWTTTASFGILLAARRHDANPDAV